MKTQHLRATLGLIFAYALFAIAPGTQAAIATASASIDWSTFKITAFDTGSGLPTWTFDSQIDNALTRYNGGVSTSDEQSQPNWATGTQANINGTDATTTPAGNFAASAQTSASIVRAEASLTYGCAVRGHMLRI